MALERICRTVLPLTVDEFSRIQDVLHQEITWTTSLPGKDKCEKVVVFAKESQLECLVERFKELYTELGIYMQLRWKYYKVPPVEGQWKVVSLCYSCGTVISIGKDKIPGFTTLRMDNLSRCWYCYSFAFLQE